MTTVPADDRVRTTAEGARRRWKRPVLILATEFVVLAIPFNAAYGYAMQVVYRVGPAVGFLFALLLGALLCNAYWLWGRFVARRDTGELSLRKAGGLAYGVLLGAMLMCAAIAVISLGGDVKLSAGSGPALAGLPGVAVLAGFAEELIARGVVLRNLENVFGSAVALVLTAMLFGALHLGNPHATWLSTTAVGVEGGVMLAAVYMATRSLWWTIGVHFAWNFTQTSIFGIADSGHPGGGFLQSEIAGPDWLTGGAFGVETSLVSVLLCAVVAAYFLMRAHRAHRFVAPIWSSHR